MYDSSTNRYGDVELKIPEGTQPNTKFRLKGKGVKSRSDKGMNL